MRAPSEQIESFVRCDPPDVFYGVFVGVIEPAQMRAFCLEQRRFAEGKPYIFGLLDISRAAPISPEARRVAGEVLAGVPIRATAIVGANFRLRVLATLAVKVVNLFGRNQGNPMRFFATEPEARAWLAARREELRGASHVSG